MRTEGKTVVFVMAMLLLAGLVPLIPASSAEPDTRAPEKLGHITADETWNDPTNHDITFDDVTIDQGVTVTVSPNNILKPYTDSFLQVDGTLILNGGSSGNRVVIGDIGGNNWAGITVGVTGNIIMDNVTMNNVQTDNVRIGGASSRLNNAVFNAGVTGITYLAATGTHSASNIMAVGQISWGVTVQSSNAWIDLKGLNIQFSGKGGIGIAVSRGVSMSDVTIRNAKESYILLQQSNNITLDGYSFIDTSPVNETAGVYLYTSAFDIDLKDGYMEGVNHGILADTAQAKRVRVTGLRTNPNIVNAVVNSASVNGLEMDLIDCDLNAAKNITKLECTSPTIKLRFINTTWDRSKLLGLKQKAELEISWYVEGKVVDGKGRTIPATLEYCELPDTEPTSIDMPQGRFGKTLLRDRTKLSVGHDEVYVHDLSFRSDQYPINVHTMDNMSFDRYTYMTVMLDLDPVSTMPSTIEVMEDVWLEYDLYTGFMDPEGEDLSFTYEVSENITVEQTGGITSGDIRVKNTVKNWFGTGWVVFEAKDTADNSTLVNVTVKVLPVNDPPYFIVPLPGPVIDEDTSTFVNLSGKITDPEGDPIIVTFPQNPLYTLVWNEAKKNLTITPRKDFFGLLEIPVNLTDGADWTVEILYVIVRAVNDPPTFTLKYPDGDVVPTGEYPKDVGPDLSVYLFEIDEDEPVSFSVIATDVDDSNLTYRIKASDFRHGTISQDTVEPWKFTYTPHENDPGGDLVRVNVTDGKVTVSKWIWFKVAPVNDAPVFEAPEEWSLHVDIGTREDIDIGELISDVDGDELTVTVNRPQFVTVSGTTLQVLVTEAFKGSVMEVLVTVSDGTTEVTRTLWVHLDNWVETFLEDMKVRTTTSKWKVEIKGDEGLTLYLVIEDAGGNTTSFPLLYEDGKYRVEVPKDAAEKDLEFWISQEQDGEKIGPGYSDVLPALRKESRSFPWWILLIILGIILIAGVVLYLVFTRSGGYGGEVGSVDEE
ncbi:MAG: tandem-95 repeat protein [Candidatus Thermoplasmatota archaeon]|nr:tandem-95 repeat protein [Candidatus Thermoplasmatota archaeon]